MIDVAGLTRDGARLFLEEVARGGLPPDDPGVVRLLSGLGWRLERALSPRRAAWMVEEVRRTFGVNLRTAATVVREAHDCALQGRLEALLVPRMSAEQLARIVQVHPNISALGGPALVVFPHAGNVLVLLAALARRAEGLVVFGDRGPGRSRADRRRLTELDRMPIAWEADPGAIAGWWERGRVVALGFDDRGFSRYRPMELLGRPALLSPEPWDLAERMGVPAVPVAIRRDRDKVNRVTIGAPRPAELERYVRAEAEPFLREHPGQYAAFLAECRRTGQDTDHPLFVDTAPDDRWKRWLTEAGPVD